MRILRRKNKENPAPSNAILEAQQNLQEVKDRASEVTAVASETREIRVRNHFAEGLEQMISRRPIRRRT